MPESFEWEIIVVENNSTDKTRAVVEEYCQQYPKRFRYLLEARPLIGLAHSWRCGLRFSAPRCYCTTVAAKLVGAPGDIPELTNVVTLDAPSVAVKLPPETGIDDCAARLLLASVR